MNFRSCRGFISFKESIWSESSWGESMNGMDSPIQAFFGSPASSWERLSPSSGNVRLRDPCDWQVRFPLEERQERCCLTRPPPLAHFSVQQLNGQAVSAQACSPTQQQPLMPPPLLETLALGMRGCLHYFGFFPTRTEGTGKEKRNILGKRQ